MQIRNLHRILSELIREGHSYSTVCINKRTFEHALESDGAVIMEVKSVEVQNYPVLDDDGGMKHTEDGYGVTKTSLVLKGKQ